MKLNNLYKYVVSLFLISLICFVFINSSRHSSINYEIKDRTLRLNDFLNRKLKSDYFPGVQYFVFKPKNIEYSFAGGYSNILENKPMTESSHMMVYNLTKFVTAIAVLQLVEKNVLTLDDSAKKHLSYLPYDETITIRHLLNQSSGIQNPIGSNWVHPSDNDPIFNEDLSFQETVLENPALKFKPGLKFASSNLSFWILGKIIEKVSQTNYKNYVRENIFQKLNISHKEMDFYFTSEDLKSLGYSKRWYLYELFQSLLSSNTPTFSNAENLWVKSNEIYVNGPAYGGLICNGRGLGKILQDLISEDSLLLDNSMKKLLFEQQKDNDGNPIESSLGLEFKFTGSLIYYYLQGSGQGFRSEFRIYPEQKLSTLIIANSSNFYTKSMLNVLDSEFVFE